MEALWVLHNLNLLEVDRLVTAARDPDAVEEPAARGNKLTEFKEVHTDADFITRLPSSDAGEGAAFTALKRVMAEDGISKATLTRRLPQLMAAGLAAKTEDGRWRRTKSGDQIAEAELRKRRHDATL